MDDKCRVVIGKTAVTRQSPVLMHMRYRVCIPDHDYSVGPKHYLTPSVYMAMETPLNTLDINKMPRTGPLYVAVRSGMFLQLAVLNHVRLFLVGCLHVC